MKKITITFTIAIAIIAKIIFADPEFQTKDKNYLQWGKRLTRAGKLDSAEKILIKAVKKNKNNPEAYFSLGYVYYKKGKFRLIPFEKLLQLLKVDNYSTAIKNFNKALKLKPDYWEARYYLARTYLAQNKEKSLRKAEQEFLKILDHDKYYKDIPYQLALVYKKLDEYNKAIFLFQQIVAENQNDGKAYIKLAEIYFAQGQNKQACYFFNSGIENVKDENTLDEIYIHLQNLMTKEEREEYEKAPLAKKGLIIKKFWKLRDPTPGTVLNERLVEHYRRIKFAQENFHIAIPPYYDDRGKIYIKFGEPDIRYTSPIGEVAMRGNESWSYEKLHKGLIFDFVENGGVFRQVQDLREAAGPASDEAHRYVVAIQLYSQRSHISDSYAKLGSYFTSVLNSPNLLMSSDIIQKYNSLITDLTIDRNKAILETPPEVYRPSTVEKPLPIVYRMAQFRGNHKNSKLDIYFGVLGHAFSYKKESNNRYYANLKYSLVAIDTSFNEVINLKDKAKLEADKKTGTATNNFVLRHSAELSPGDYWINLVAEEPEAKLRALIKKKVNIKDFSGPHLKISDIQLSFQIAPATEHSPPQYIKKGLEIVPYPFYSVHRKNPIYIYYEIYNLKYNQEGKVKYSIEYQIKTLKPRENFWSRIGKILGRGPRPAISLYEKQTGDNSFANKYIAFDLGKLNFGVTQLKVTVIDNVSGEKTSSAVEFDLIK